MADTHAPHAPRSGGFEASDIIKLILAVLLPPLGVALEVGLGKHFWINVVLTILGYIPGIIHAVYVILTR